jgi:hypothetical protein
MMRNAKLLKHVLCASVLLTFWQALADATGELNNNGPSTRPAFDSRWTTPSTEQFPRGTWICQLDGTFIHPFSGRRHEQFVGGHAGV